MKRYEFVDGWCTTIERRRSPNCDKRPPGEVVDLLVIHAISLPPRKYGGDFIDQFFLNRLDVAADPYFQEIAELKVSTHFVIDRNGYTRQYVSILDRAWHCGESLFCGRTCCNDFSIGIELEGCDEEPFTEAQYAELATLVRSILAAHPAITEERVVGHADIAPGRKTDPGPLFDWVALRTAIQQPQQS